MFLELITAVRFFPVFFTYEIVFELIYIYICNHSRRDGTVNIHPPSSHVYSPINLRPLLSPCRLSCRATTKRSPAMTRNRTNRGLGIASCIPHGAFSTHFLRGMVFSILRRVFSKTLSGVSFSSCKVRRHSDRPFNYVNCKTMRLVLWHSRHGPSELVPVHSCVCDNDVLDGAMFQRCWNSLRVDCS